MLNNSTHILLNKTSEDVELALREVDLGGIFAF